MSNIIALLTDFGLEDTYVGVMKAVMMNICPDARIVDITHAIQPQNVREAAFALMNSYRYFPTGTTFCVVVDPGVGSTRLPVAVKTADYQFIAPNNGVLSYALATVQSDYQAVILENPQYQQLPVSQTFHGRDIFSPAAAYIAHNRETLTAMGKQLTSIFTFPAPQLTYAKQRLVGEVMHIDHFGNIITSTGHFIWSNDDELELAAGWHRDIPPLRFHARDAHITIHSHTIHGISRAYHEVQPGSILAQIDSNGFLEIGANQDSAADRLDVQAGDKVMLKLSWPCQPSEMQLRGNRI